MKPRWKSQVDSHDYAAARDYLTVLLDEGRAIAAVAALVTGPLTTRRANDILRGCHREPLPTSDVGVKRVLKKIKRGKALSPVLVVSFDNGGDIADGYHRVSAAYRLDPFAPVPLKLAHVPDLTR